jgi:hypothetical protein
MLGVLGESTGMYEARATGVTNEERRDHEVDLVHEPRKKELAMNGAATFDHQALDLAVGEIVQHDS